MGVSVLPRSFSSQVQCGRLWVLGCGEKLRVVDVLLIQGVTRLFLVVVLNCLLMGLEVLGARRDVILSGLSLCLIVPTIVLDTFRISFGPRVRWNLVLTFITTITVRVLLLVVKRVSNELFRFRRVSVTSVVCSGTKGLVVPVMATILKAG